MLEYQRCCEAEAAGADDAWDGFDEEELDIRKLVYKRALKQLRIEFPELELQLSEQVEGVKAAASSCRPCPCGHGLFAHQWPWMLRTEALGFCQCEEATLGVLDWRDKYIPRGMHWC